MSDKAHPDVTIEIGGKPRVLRFSQNRVLYRLSSIAEDVDESGLRDPKRGFSSLINFIWAMLEDSRDYPKPVDLAEDIDLERAGELAEAVQRAIELGTEVKQEDEEQAPYGEKKSILPWKRGHSGGSR